MPSLQNTYMVGIRSVADYSPFGVELDGRTQSGAGYRYSFQGQEKDDEIKGEGNSINYKYRMHDPRVGRFFAVDPLAPKYPWNSVYAFSENVVINAVELEGLERRYTFNSKFTTQKFFKIYEQFQKGGKSFDDLRKYLDSRTGYRMGDQSTEIAQTRLAGGKTVDFLSFDEYQGVPYIATDQDIANDNYFIVSYIVETKDGNYDRESFEIVRDGYAPDIGIDMEKMKNNSWYDPQEGGHDSANLGTLSSMEKKILKKTGEFIYYSGQLILEVVQKVMLPIIVDPIIYPNTTQTDQPLMSVNGDNK